MNKSFTVLRFLSGLFFVISLSVFGARAQSANTPRQVAVKLKNRNAVVTGALVRMDTDQLQIIVGDALRAFAMDEVESVNMVSPQSTSANAVGTQQSTPATANARTLQMTTGAAYTEMPPDNLRGYTKPHDRPSRRGSRSRTASSTETPAVVVAERSNAPANTVTLAPNTSAATTTPIINSGNRDSAANLPPAPAARDEKDGSEANNLNAATSFAEDVGTLRGRSRSTNSSTPTPARTTRPAVSRRESVRARPALIVREEKPARRGSKERNSARNEKARITERDSKRRGSTRDERSARDKKNEKAKNDKNSKTRDKDRREDKNTRGKTASGKDAKSSKDSQSKRNDAKSAKTQKGRKGKG